MIKDESIGRTYGKQGEIPVTFKVRERGDDLVVIVECPDENVRLYFRDKAYMAFDELYYKLEEQSIEESLQILATSCKHTLSRWDDCK